ncbi:MAG: hypothetical protein KJ601_07860 [Nanoarchaeota archaeon]|nr:hypothetical protein [Nanoarchaeota archaeon]MBU1703735.1 hypothetical protein [Nanoarchaeota archaeon]
MDKSYLEIKEQILSNPDAFDFNRRAIDFGTKEGSKERNELYGWLLLAQLMRLHKIKDEDKLLQTYLNRPNWVIKELNEQVRRQKLEGFIEALVDTEIMLDNLVFKRLPNERMTSFPPYWLFNNVVVSSQSSGVGAKNIVTIDKEMFRLLLIYAKKIWLQHGYDPKTFAEIVYHAIRIHYDVAREHHRWTAELGGQNHRLSYCYKQGICNCVHISIIFQLFAQTAGFDSTVVDGRFIDYNPQEREVFREDHSCNIIVLNGQIVLVDLARLMDYETESRPLIFPSKLTLSQILGENWIGHDIQVPLPKGGRREYIIYCGLSYFKDLKFFHV